MNTTTTLFNPYLRTCYATAGETPDGGTPPAQQQTPPPAAPTADPLPGTPPPSDNEAPATPPPGTTPQDTQEDAADFSLDKEPPPAQEQQPNPDRKEDGDKDKKKPEKEYVLELPDDLEVTDEFKNILKDHARESGLDGKAAGKYVSGVIKAMEEAEQANIAQGTKELREDWGNNFNANMNAVKAFAFKLRGKSGLTPEDLAPLQSPKGYRLLFAMTQLMGEDSFVKGDTAPINDPQQEAHRMLTDPTHKYYEAMRDQTNPLFLEANRIYNNLVSTAP